MSGEDIQVKEHITLETTSGEGTYTKEIEFSYLIVNAMSPYNIILGRPTINELREVISTEYLVLKYLLLDGRV